MPPRITPLSANPQRAKEPWERGLEAFIAAKFRHGQLVRYEWLYQAMGLEMWKPNMLAWQAKQLEFAFLQQFTPFRRELRERHQIELRAPRDGTGYRILHPQEQTAWADKDGERKVHKDLREWHRRLVNVDASKLNEEQRRENSQSLTVLTRLREIERASRRPRFQSPPEQATG